MYLEISGRRTGKTTRLLTAMTEAAQDGKPPILFCHNGQWRRQVINEYLDEFLRKKVKVFCRKEDYHKTYEGHSTGHHRIFYDEFDFFDPGNVIVTHTGYYNTTPKKVRTIEDIIMHRIGAREDVFLTLLECNAYQYSSYAAMPLMCRDLSVDEIKGRFEQMTGHDHATSEILGIPFGI